MPGPSLASPMNHPQPIRVSTDAEGGPIMVQLPHGRRAVVRVQAHWVGDAAPGEGPREYFLLRLESELLCCVFFAPDQQQWYHQRVSQKSWAEGIPADLTRRSLR